MPEIAQDVVRHERAVDERIARLDVLAGLDPEVGPGRNLVFRSSPIAWPSSVSG